MSGAKEGSGPNNVTKALCGSHCKIKSEIQERPERVLDKPMRWPGGELGGLRTIEEVRDLESPNQDGSNRKGLGEIRERASGETGGKFQAVLRLWVSMGLAMLFPPGDCRGVDIELA